MLNIMTLMFNSGFKILFYVLSLLSLLSLMGLFTQALAMDRMTIYGRDAELNPFRDHQLVCDSDTSCHFSYQLMIVQPNVTFVCFEPHQSNNAVDCYPFHLYDDHNSYVSFCMSSSPKPFILQPTINYASNWTAAMIIQCMNYNQYYQSSSFCLGQFYE
jgi:hypothetical protein